MEVPHSDVSVRAAGEAHLGVGAYGERVASRSGGCELRLYAWRLRGQVPNGQRAGLTAHDQGAAVGQQLAGADVVVPVLPEKTDTACERAATQILETFLPLHVPVKMWLSALTTNSGCSHADRRMDGMKTARMAS